MNAIIKASIAEFIGTFALMLVGGGAIIMTHIAGASDGGLIAVALAHGLILSVMVSAAMHISGGQFNPAVSIALCVIGRQEARRGAAIVLSQVVGSVIAAFILKAVFDATHAAAVESARLGATLGGIGLGTNAIFLLEVIATFFLMFVIIGTAVDSRGVGKGPMVGGFGIGLTVAANILFFGPATGASMNPARSFGPALIGGHWELHWLYWLAPIIGASLAALVWQYGIGLREEK